MVIGRGDRIEPAVLPKVHGQNPDPGVIGDLVDDAADGPDLPAA